MLRSLSEKPLRLPRFFSRSIPKDAARILTFNDERESIVAEVVDRVVSKHSSTAKRIEAALAEAAFHEIKRLEAQRDDEARAHLGAWRSMLRRVPHMTRDEAEDELRRIVLRMTNDVYVPTHLSNFDSIVFGYALERGGPPAGDLRRREEPLHEPGPLVLHAQPRRVPRRPAAPAQPLQGRAQDLLLRAARARLPLALLPRRHALALGRVSSGASSSGSWAARRGLRRTLIAGKERADLLRPRDHQLPHHARGRDAHRRLPLRGGQGSLHHRGRRVDALERLFAFSRKIVRLRAACVIRFGRPVDPYGNLVTDEAESLAPDGRVIDASTYVRMHGVPTLDAARDAAYTRSLSDVLVAAYRRETVVMGTQLVAHVLFRALAQDARGLDTFAMLRLREVSFDAAAIFAEIGKTRDRLLALVEKGEVHASAVVRSDPPEELVRRAFEVWSGYHTRPSARHEGSRIIIEDPTLLLYYQNRLVAFAEDIAGPEHAEAARASSRTSG
jgi:glycerol-3-phosphate O-acyltransferase